MTATQPIETIQGDLRAYAQLEPDTFQTARQVNQDRMTNHSLCNVLFHTADGNAYQAQKGSSVLWGITSEKSNLILTHLFDTENSSFD